MELKLRRIAKKSEYTIGKLSVDGKYFCDTLEDTDRGLTSAMSKEQIAKLKVKGKTAIPTGRYRVDMNTVSPRFGAQSFYKSTCNGKLPRLVDVKGYGGVLIHVGNYAKDTEGCLLVGRNTIVGAVTDSKATFQKLYAKMKTATSEIYITIE